MIAFVDTEYTYDSEIKRNRLISICVLKYTPDGVYDCEYNGCVKPDGWEVSPMTANITGLSTVMLEEKGISIHDVMTNVGVILNNVSLFVAHHVGCDRNVILNELIDCKLDTDIISGIRTYDTMKDIMGTISLSKLHYKMFGEVFTNGHDARADAFACARCYFLHHNKEMDYDIPYEIDTEPEFVASEEQQRIVDACAMQNVIVNAVPGSGKTTTCFAISKAYANERVLLLTYSRTLKDDVLKNKPPSVFNLDTYTFHGVCGKMYNKSVHNDFIMHNCIYGNDSKKCASRIKYDLIIIDEAQDMTDLSYACVQIAIATYSKITTRVCILGDENQCLYQYAGGDARYLTRASEIFANESKWDNLSLSTSFRLTNQNAIFMNKCIIGYEKIKTVRDGTKPTFIYANLFEDDANSACSIVVNKIIEYMNMGYNASDIFILVNSVKGNNKRDKKNTPISRLSNAIQHKIPNVHIYSSLSDEKTSTDSACSTDKLVISTYHQSKGRQRKIVIVYGISNWKNKTPAICPNALYVAMTRAQEHLVIVQNSNSEKLPFLYDDVSKYCDVIGTRAGENKEETNNGSSKPCSVTALCSHLSHKNMIECLKYFDCIELPIHGNSTTIATYSNQVYKNGASGVENVSAINGVVLPMMYQLNATGKCDLLDTIRKTCTLSTMAPIIGAIDANKILTQYTHDDMYIVENALRVGAAWSSYTSGFGFVNNQLMKCNWLTQDEIYQAALNIDTLKHSANVKCEVCISTHGITGFIDAFDIEKKIVYEYKCTNGDLKNEHMLQLAVYMALCVALNCGDLKYILYNILSGQTIEIKSTPEKLDYLLKYLIRVKSTAIDDVSDDAFINNCESIVSQLPKC